MKRRQLVLCSLVVLLLPWSSLGWTPPPKPGGTLRIALPGDPAFYDAHQGPAMGAQAFWTSNNIYNSLLATPYGQNIRTCFSTGGYAYTIARTSACLLPSYRRYSS